MLNIGRVPDAQAEFQKAVELDPTYADAFHNLGSAYAEQAKWEDAIVAYRKALAQTIYNRPETTYNNLGYAYWALDRRRDAEDAFRAALQLDPSLVPSHFWLGVLLQKEGRQAGGEGSPPCCPGPRSGFHARKAGRRGAESDGPRFQVAVLLGI